MSMYDDALKKLDTGPYIKLKAGDTKTLRILDHPHVGVKAWEDNIANRFYWLVWDYDMQSVRILEQGKGVFEDIARIIKKWPKGDTMPSPFDIVIEREGGGQYDTKYSVDGIPHTAEIPDVKLLVNSIDRLLESIRVNSRAIPLQDIIAGVKPEVIAAGKSTELLESGEKRPTHQDAQALERDVVIQDLDTDKPIDLDAIPF